MGIAKLFWPARTSAAAPQVTGLKDAVSTLTTERDTARERATALQVSLAALEATRDALRDERDRLLTREQLRESRSWWPWRRSA